MDSATITRSPHLKPPIGTRSGTRESTGAYPARRALPTASDECGLETPHLHAAVTVDSIVAGRVRG